VTATNKCARPWPSCWETPTRCCLPSGCFEQTTSTAWPNVLVTAYLKQTRQLKPEVQLKAESLMSAGYQRLLTFEHAGGGYSWFGEQEGRSDFLRAPSRLSLADRCPTRSR
jgi:hypothetical protein